MQKINKGEPLPDFLTWKDGEGRGKKYDDISPELKRQMREYMLQNEQNGVCGYTELPLTCDTSHIDHYKKQGQGWFPELQLEWTNFVVASMHEDFGARYKDNHYGLKKNDYGSFYNPVESGMEDVVYYDGNGQIHPKDPNNHKVEKTIKVFYLDHKSLNDRRKSIIENVKLYFENGMDREVIKESLRGQGFPSVVDWELDFLQNTTP